MILRMAGSLGSTKDGSHGFFSYRRTIHPRGFKRHTLRVFECDLSFAGDLDINRRVHAFAQKKRGDLRQRDLDLRLPAPVAPP